MYSDCGYYDQTEDTHYLATCMQNVDAHLCVGVRTILGNKYDVSNYDINDIIFV